VNVLILGVNGFIGNALTERIMAETDWEVYGMDLSASKLGHSIENPRFHFIEYHVKNKCDVVLPLVAIATPAIYVKDPLRVFELDFEENLRVIRQCVKYGKRVIFPSSSEVYGMCQDTEFDEHASFLVLGPVAKQRWIYSCAKQLLDRVIWAYGQKGALRFTLIRPFNWIGPRLDDVNSALEGSSRVVTQFIVSLVRGEPIRLVDGGEQRRCFTYIDDGIECLMKIIADDGSKTDGEIFNIGNPANECSIRELAAKMREIYSRHPDRSKGGKLSEIVEVGSQEYYGAGYQDILTRKPSIRRAAEKLLWRPRTGLDEALRKTIDFFLAEMKASGHG